MGCLHARLDDMSRPWCHWQRSRPVFILVSALQLAGGTLG